MPSGHTPRISRQLARPGFRHLRSRRPPDPSRLLPPSPVIWAEITGYRRRSLRLILELVYGLLNPVLYLAILTPTLLSSQSAWGWWIQPLSAAAWILLAAFWCLRIFGAALVLNSTLVRTFLAAAIVCILLHGIKDLVLVLQLKPSDSAFFTTALNILRLAPLYLIPAVLLTGYIRRPQTLFLLPDRSSRVAIAATAAVALVTFGLAAHRRSDASVRRLISSHRTEIRAAAQQYDVDPRLIASIVYVTHRDQLSPFRGALERVLIHAWARNLRGDFGVNPPDRTGPGADENPLLNRALDISIGIAQIKPRTAQTASVLATGRTPSALSKPIAYAYLEVEPLNAHWLQPISTAAAPIPVPAPKHQVAEALLNDRSNLATCALILSLYQQQWETANPAWNLRNRPDILATLYQIGFARSKPHFSPRANSFGARVAQIHNQPWPEL